jgi:hypothetical protein
MGNHHPAQIAAQAAMCRRADRRRDRQRSPPRARRPRPGSAPHAGAGRGSDGCGLVPRPTSFSRQRDPDEGESCESETP